MVVQQEERVEAVVEDGRRDVFEDVFECPALERDSAAEGQVMGRIAFPDGWRHRNRNIVGHLFGAEMCDRADENRISGYGEMRTVLFDAADWNDNDRPIGLAKGSELGGGTASPRLRSTGLEHHTGWLEHRKNPCGGTGCRLC